MLNHPNNNLVQLHVKVRTSVLHVITTAQYHLFLTSWPCNNLAHLDLMFVTLKGFHDHQDRFQLAVKPAVLTVEPIHAARHITQKLNKLRLLLRTSQLQT